MYYAVGGQNLFFCIRQYAAHLLLGFLFFFVLFFAAFLFFFVLTSSMGSYEDDVMGHLESVALNAMFINYQLKQDTND